MSVSVFGSEPAVEANLVHWQRLAIREVANRTTNQPFCGELRQFASTASNDDIKAFFSIALQANDLARLLTAVVVAYGRQEEAGSAEMDKAIAEARAMLEGRTK